VRVDPVELGQGGIVGLPRAQQPAGLLVQVEIGLLDGAGQGPRLGRGERLLGRLFGLDLFRLNGLLRLDGFLGLRLGLLLGFSAFAGAAFFGSAFLGAGLASFLGAGFFSAFASFAGASTFSSFFFGAMMITPC